MTEAENIQAGITALRSGDRAKAAALFAQVVKQNPISEQGWYLLGMSVASPEQREYCLKRVLAINPNNEQARSQLNPPPASPSSFPYAGSYTEPVSQPFISPQPASISEPVSQPLKPFNEDSDSSLVFEQVEFREAESPASEPPAARKKSPTRKKHSSSRIIIFSLAASLLVGVCTMGIAVFMLRERLFGSNVPLLPPATQALPPLIATQTLPPLLPTATFIVPTPTVLPSPLPTVAYTPKFEEASCWFELDSVDVRCGYVTVPESRSGDPSDTIRLAVAVFKAENSKKTPVMFLQGGPGAEAVQLSADAYEVLVEPFTEERDFIVFDQRGTGLSEPGLTCEELQRTHKQDIYGNIAADTRRLVYGNSFLSCNGLLRAQGVNLNAYTTMESAADVKDILQLLGYERVHLYGASYGTRLAQVVMREHPQIVETAILDSVVPVESNFFKLYPEAIQGGLRKLFDACMMDVKCNTAYPNLETVFWEAYNSLNAEPVTLTTSIYPIGSVTETVDGTVFMSTVLGSIKSSYFIHTAPQTIYRVKGGDFSTLIAAQYSLPFAFDGINPGLYISMMCHEHVLATTPQELEAVSSQPGINSYAWLPFYGDANDVYKSCQSWGAVGPLLGENDPVVSEIPSLVITGSYDPTTPPKYGRQLAEHLPNSYYFEFENQGHVPSAADSSGCAMDTVLDFLDNPIVEPNRDCMDDLKKVEFLTPYTGTPPLKMTSTELFGITVDVPDDWYWDWFGGFFVRANSPFDITQIGAFRTYFSSASELKDYFSLSAYGYRGLDAAPIEAGTHTANGRIWMLYTGKSNNRPVDLAIADLGSTSYVIMMFSHADERDALYNTLFLPMIDSAR